MGNVQEEKKTAVQMLHAKHLGIPLRWGLGVQIKYIWGSQDSKRLIDFSQNYTAEDFKSDNWEIGVFYLFIFNF